MAPRSHEGTAQMNHSLFEEITTAIEGTSEAFDAFKTVNEERIEALADRIEEVEARASTSDASLGPAAKASEAKFLDQLRGKAMSTDSNPDGGSMVPHQIDRRIADQLVDVSPIRRVAEVVQTETRDYTKLVNRRGASSGWGSEQTTRTETNTPLLAEINPPSGELWAYPSVSTWALDDAAFNVENFLASNVATEFAFQEGAAFVNGDGVNRPRGFLTYATDATADDVRDFGTVEHLAAASPTAINEDELVQLLYKLRPSYRQGPGVAWVMNSTTASQVRLLKDAQGRFLWADGLQPGQPPNLLGYPVVEAEDMPDAATGTLPIAFGNWSRGYLVTDRTGTRLIRDDVTRPGFVRFYFARRTGGALTDSNAIKLLKMA
jgi:HK97 family phage major capsid protein